MQYPTIRIYSRVWKCSFRAFKLLGQCDLAHFIEGNLRGLWFTKVFPVVTFWSEAFWLTTSIYIGPVILHKGKHPSFVKSWYVWLTVASTVYSLKGFFLKKGSYLKMPSNWFIVLLHSWEIVYIALMANQFSALLDFIPSLGVISILYNFLLLCIVKLDFWFENKVTALIYNNVKNCIKYFLLQSALTIPPCSPHRVYFWNTYFWVPNIHQYMHLNIKIWIAV